jgi:hypothetical protein
MNHSRSSDQSTATTALILFQPGDSGLWNPEFSKLTERLEAELDVFVTHASTGKHGLSPAGSLSAARYMGCSHAVVILPFGVDPRAFGAGNGSDISISFATAPWREGSIGRVFRAMQQLEAKAA